MQKRQAGTRVTCNPPVPATGRSAVATLENIPLAGEPSPQAEKAAVLRHGKAGFSTSQDCPRPDNLVALEMTENLEVSLLCDLKLLAL